MALVMPYSMNDQTLPYLVDSSGYAFATDDQLTAEGWLFENPFFPGQPVAPAGFGLSAGMGTGTGTGIGTSVGVGVGVGTTAGLATNSAEPVGENSWDNGGDLDSTLSAMTSNGWNGMGMMDNSTQPPVLDAPYQSSAAAASTSQSSTLAPPFPNPFYGVSTPITPNRYAQSVPPQQYQVSDMVPLPLDIASFENFPSRPIPTGARYDQLLHAKLGSPPDFPNLMARGPAVAPPTPLTSMYGSTMSAGAMAGGYPYNQPQYDSSANNFNVPYVDTTTSVATTSTATTLTSTIAPNPLIPQTTIPPSLGLPLAAGSVGYTSSTSTTSSPVNLPTSQPNFIPLQQQQQPQMLQQGVHFHPAPISLPTGVQYYQLLPQASQLQPGSAYLPVMDSLGAKYSGYPPTPNWPEEQRRAPSRTHSRTPTLHSENEAGPSRASSYPHQSQPQHPLPQHSHSQPLVSHHSVPNLRAGYYQWQQQPAAGSSASALYHPQHQDHQTRVQSLAHNPHLPQHPQSYQLQPNFSYPPSYRPSDLPGNYPSWSHGMPSTSSISTTSTGDRSSLHASGMPRSRSASSFIHHTTNSTPNGSIHGDSEDTYEPVQKAQRKRRKTKSETKDRKPDVEQSDGQPESEERKVVIACHACRAKKLRCDGGRPRCHNCTRKDEPTCSYDLRLKRRGQGKKTKEKELPDLRPTARSVSSVSARSGGRARAKSGAGAGMGLQRGESMSTPAGSRAPSPLHIHVSSPPEMTVKVEAGS